MKKNNNKISKEQNKKNINEKAESKPNSDNKCLQKEKEVEKPKNIEAVNLIKTIKSELPIIENIFSFLEEHTKLFIIVHNKKYQNLLGLDINYYKNKSGKYRIIEKNGICKEYTLDENKLIFEGEFKNGKKMAKQKNLILVMVKFHLKEHI